MERLFINVFLLLWDLCDFFVLLFIVFVAVVGHCGLCWLFFFLLLVVINFLLLLFFVWVLFVLFPPSSSSSLVPCLLLSLLWQSGRTC